MKAIGIVFTTMWKHEVLKQAQVPARDQASARRQWLSKFNTFAQRAQEVMKTSQGEVQRRNTQ